jgi:hypothetical protein
MTGRVASGVVRVVALAFLGTVAEANAEPLVTISCEKPTGFTIAYGVPLTDQADAAAKHQPEPAPALKGPITDGYLAKPTFVVDSDRKKVTIIWVEPPEEVEFRKLATQLNLPQLPPPPATDATIVSFFKEQISAIEAEPWSIMTYSFFPTVGKAFIGQQFIDLGSKNIRQLATFAHCEFSWNSPH